LPGRHPKPRLTGQSGTKASGYARPSLKSISTIRSQGAAVISDLDVWRAANLLIRQHGAEAEIEAARVADLMLDRGDDEGRPVWSRIRRAIDALQAPPQGKPN
jgi:hypothetical protein